MATKTTKPRTVTYLGRRAQVWEVRLTGPHGFRREFCRWVDDAHEKNGGHKAGTVVTKLMLGDGRKPNSFKLYELRTITEQDLNDTDWHAQLERAATVLFEK